MERAKVDIFSMGESLLQKVVVFLQERKEKENVMIFYFFFFFWTLRGDDS